MWPKNGCDLNDDCFTCPFPDCVADQHQIGAKKAKRLEVLEMLGKGYNARQIAAALEMSRRTVFRIKKVSSASY